MSRSTPVMKTRCSNCLKKRKLGTFTPSPDGEIIGYTRIGYPRLKCQKCGHIWVSRSIVGRKLKRQHARIAEGRDKNLIPIIYSTLYDTNRKGFAMIYAPSVDKEHDEINRLFYVIHVEGHAHWSIWILNTILITIDNYKYRPDGAKWISIDWKPD